MPRLIPSRRDASGLRLKVRSADGPGRGPNPSDEPSGPSLPWYVSGLLAGLGGALGGWLIVAGLVVLAWLAARAEGLTGAVNAGTQAWLLANGGGLVLDDQRLTLIPFGVTILFVLLLSGLAQSAARHAVDNDEALGVDLSRRDRGRITRNVSLIAGLAYAACVTLAASVIGTANQGARALVGALAIGLLAAYAGASRGTGHRLADALPGWAAPLPGALRAGLATALAGGAAALVTTLVLHRQEVAALYDAMAPDGPSQAALTVLQLLFWPTLLVWATAYSLGAGFTLGEGSLVSPANTDLGLLPGVPVFGALPVEGSGSYATLAWMAVGVVAGAVAAVVVVRGRPRARFDETAVVGGLAGVLTALVLVAVAAVCRGDLGDGRLTGIGPRLPELALLGGSLMGLSGLVTGFVTGLVRRPTAEDPPSDKTKADEETLQLARSREAD